MKFAYVPPLSASAEKVKVEVSPQVLAWADSVAQEHPGSTRESVLEQAIAYAFRSATRPVRDRTKKAKD